MDNKVDLLLIQLPDINIISPAQKFDADHVFIDPAIIHISAAQDCIPDSGIAEIEFFRAFQILLSPDIKALHVVEYKGITKVFDVFADGDVVGNSLTGSQQLADLVGGGQIADVVHQKFAKPLQNQSIWQGVFLYQISGYDGFIYFLDVVRSVFFGSVNIGTGQTAPNRVFLKKLINITDIIVILTVFLKTKGEHMDLNVASGKEGCQICTQQKGIGAGNVNVVFTFRIQAVDSQLKFGAHLHLVHEEIVCFSFLIMLFHISMQGMVLFDFFEGQVHEINKDDIDIFKILFQILDIGLHQFGLAGTADACDNFDVRSTVQFNDPVQILASSDCLHIATAFKNKNIFGF